MKNGKDASTIDADQHNIVQVADENAQAVGSNGLTNGIVESDARLPNGRFAKGNNAVLAKSVRATNRLRRQVLQEATRLVDELDDNGVKSKQPRLVKLVRKMFNRAEDDDRADATTNAALLLKYIIGDRPASDGATGTTMSFTFIVPSNDLDAASTAMRNVSNIVATQSQPTE